MSLISGIKNVAQMNPATEQKQTQTWRTDLWLPWGEGERNGMDWEFGFSRCKLLHLEWISDAVLLHSTGNYIQSLGIDHNGRKYKKDNVYICMTGSLCCTAEIGKTFQINYTFFFRSALVAYGGAQARGLIRAIAAS